jgi:hypothetical protein
MIISFGRALSASCRIGRFFPINVFERGWKLFLIILSIINIIAICAYDYSSRIWGGYLEKNRLQISVEIFCNAIFGIDLLLNIIA